MTFLVSVVGLCLYYYEDDSFPAFSFDSFGQRMVILETITVSEREERRLEIESAIEEGKRCSPGEDAMAVY